MSEAISSVECGDPHETKVAHGMSIPERYHHGMSKQIAVRLPDEVVDYLDGLVADGTVDSRAAAVKTALERDRRRRLAEADILAMQSAPLDELDDVAVHALRVLRESPL